MYKDFSSIGTVDFGSDALNHSIRNIILTKKGSVPGIPRFGSDLHRLVFSQMDSVTIELAKRFISEALDEWEDRISVENIDISFVPEFNKIIINLEYKHMNSTTLELASETTSIAFTQ